MITAHRGRSREDQVLERDLRLVDLLLRNYEGGYYANSVKPITQRQTKDVEVIATSATGERLAVEHTLLENFPQVWAKEERIQKATAQLRKDSSLRIPERSIWIFLPAEAFDTSQPWTWHDLDEALADWARSSLASVPVGYSIHQINVPTQSGISKSLEIKTAVSKSPGSPGAVLVHGLFPEDGQAACYLLAELERAVKNKLPKLLKTVSDKRADKAVLLLELHGALIQRDWVADQLRGNLEFEKLDAVIFVYTSGIILKGDVIFWVWHPRSNGWDGPWKASLVTQDQSV